MSNNYTSCDWLRNGIDFELDHIEICCFRCHSGGGEIKLAKIKNGQIDIKELIENREVLINENKNGKINKQCIGCFNLKNEKWLDKPSIKYIHFNHWTYCNSNCIYCYTKADEKYKNGIQNYNALPILKEILKYIDFSSEGEITFAGGEPVMLNEFEDIINYLLEIGAKKIIVHTSSVKYSEALEKALAENKAQVVISHDCGYEDTFKKIKNTEKYNQVWENTKRYARYKNVFSKYVIIPQVNDNKKEIDYWLNQVVTNNVKSVIVDIEHNYYNEVKNKLKLTVNIIELLEYIKKEAKRLGIKVSYYNTAIYLNKKYKYLIPFIKYKHYFIELIILSLPLLMGNLGQTLIGATDILVVAKYNINSLAAISIANSILFTIFIFGLGILGAISIILSNMRGSKQKTKKYLMPSLIFSLLLAVIFTIVCYYSKYLVDLMGFEKMLIPYIKEYITIVSFSMFGMFLFQGIKEFLLAYEIVKFPNLLLLAAVLINLLFDVMFVYGCGIIPPMGSKGAAIATLSVRTIMGLILLLYVFKLIKFKDMIDFKYMKQLIKIGVPIGFALLFEFLAFNIITVLVGREAGILSATHNIIITISSATFMVPLAIATAVAIKVSYYYGARNSLEIKRYSYASLIMGVGFMAVAGIILALFPKEIISIFTNNEEVLKIAMPLVIIAAMYQIFDGFQVVAGGILRGFKMTKIVSTCVLTGYWLVGAPLAYILVNKYNCSLKGYWIALAVSLFSMGIGQAVIAKWKYNKIKKIYQ